MFSNSSVSMHCSLSIKFFIFFCFIGNLVYVALFKGTDASDLNPKQIYTASSTPAKYTPDWESLDSRPLPKWYDSAKVGIFIHWGVYSVPSFGSEWFWWNWQGVKNENYTNYMNKYYKPGFTYQEFAKDFTAELFNADDWADILQRSGAQYVVLTSKHHDGYALWPSTYSFGWNAKDVGPHRDLIEELRTAVLKSTDLKFGLYHSLYEWFNPMYLHDQANNCSSSIFVDSKIWPEMVELVQKYKPEVFWSDGEWEAPVEYWKSLEFIAWLYNESPVRETVVTNDRWGHETLCHHGDFYTCTDRYNPGTLQAHKWENAFTLDKKSWGYRQNTQFEDYMTAEELIEQIVTTVSCNGNVLVNVGPTNVGTIQPIFIERLLQMGTWLKTNGKAIYGTKPWVYQNDTLTPGVWYTAGRRTGISKQNVYAIVLKYPYETNSVELRAAGNYYVRDSDVYMLGYPEKLEVHISPPKNV